MIDAQSSALAAQHGSGSATVPVAIIGVPPVMSGLCPARTPDTARETHALPMDSPRAKTSAFICANLRMESSQKDFNNSFENAFTINARQLPFNPAFLVQFAHHAKSPLTHCDSMLCAISSDESAFRDLQKVCRASRCPSTARKVKQAKRHEKNLPFFSGYFDGKTLENQAKTVKKHPHFALTILQLLTCFFRAHLAAKVAFQLKIKKSNLKTSLKIPQVNVGKYRVKILVFFGGTLTGKLMEIRQKRPKKPFKNTQKTRKF